MKKIGLIAMVLCFVIGSTSCAVFQKNSKSAKKHRTQKQMLDGTWELTYLVSGDEAKLFKSQKPFIKIDAKKNTISGFNGCNNFSGAINIDGNSISYPKIFSQTMKSCDGDGDIKFALALSNSNSFAFTENNNILDLIGGDIGQMQFKRKVTKK